jgi:chromosome segregation ATPase
VGTNDPASAEARFRESISALARVTAQLEKERGERRRVEQRAAFLSSQLENLHEELRKHLEVEKESQQRISEFEQQLREREDEVAKAVSDFQKEAAARQLVEAQLKAKGDMGSQLQERFNLLDEAKRVFNAAQEKLEARLEEASAALKQSQVKVQKQTAERKRLESLLEETQRKLQEQSQQGASEIGRLQSALQLESIERRKLESQSMQQRYASLDASRLGRAFVNSFRTHLRPTADHLLQSTRRLLELSPGEEHKKVVEDVLENALLLQTSMQDDARLPGEGDPGEAAKAA